MLSDPAGPSGQPPKKTASDILFRGFRFPRRDDHTGMKNETTRLFATARRWARIAARAAGVVALALPLLVALPVDAEAKAKPKASKPHLKAKVAAKKGKHPVAKARKGKPAGKKVVKSRRGAKPVARKAGAATAVRVGKVPAAPKTAVREASRERSQAATADDGPAALPDDPSPRVAKVACRQDGKVFLLAECNSGSPPAAVVASTEAGEAR